MKGTVLLIEDERDTREVLAKAMEREGWRCLVAEDVASAIQQARSARPIEVIVTDIVLGKDDLGGLRVLTELRTIAPVIVITAFADVARLKYALNQGASHLLEKPFSATDLLEAIERLRSGRVDVRTDVDRLFTEANLTAKERAVALRLLEGLTYSDIAELEHNSTSTIRQHVSQIYAKCGVAGRAELFRLAYGR